MAMTTPGRPAPERQQSTEVVRSPASLRCRLQRASAARLSGGGARHHLCGVPNHRREVVDLGVPISVW
jgi:hypothetical protein